MLVHHFTSLSSGAVGTDHLSCLCNLGTAATVRARARLTITRSANQSISIVTIEALLTSYPSGEVGTLTYAWSTQRGEQQLHTPSKHMLVPACIPHCCFSTLWVWPQKVKFFPSSAERAVSLILAAATPYRYSSPQPNPVKKTISHSPPWRAGDN